MLKADAILNMGAFLKKSSSMVVVWDETYLSRPLGTSFTPIVSYP